MSELAIKAEGISKQYKIGVTRDWNNTLRDQLASGIGRIGRKSKANTRVGTDTFWALKDVSFEINQGEVVGVIGRNGAGKSTLLKVLSRITEPTGGYADMYGRVGSLLEVGTGFHPELSGRENIYLNGAIIGMKRAEIERKFDEIVAFAEVDKFIDTPVKRYSSGMYVRLAFAVAAHMETEILIVDEVLAVGDLQFQEKCLGKMNTIADEGRTVLFVSHNIGAIQRLCRRVMLMDSGTLLTTGSPTSVVQDYMSFLRRDSARLPLPTSGDGIGLKVNVLAADGSPTIVWPYRESIIVDVLVSTREVLSYPAVDVSFYTGERVPFFTLRSDMIGPAPEKVVGDWRVRFEVQNPGITAPEILFDVGLRTGSAGYTHVEANVGTLSADPETIPRTPQSDWLVWLDAQAHWEQVATRIDVISDAKPMSHDLSTPKG